ncbi:hypothetical protein BDV34DRAFT_192978 [Aspergillus parasiticus]|uniref:Uncharacterized protein n=1 Tax=Aspergillus parasiticus TaxID=5067 RepID=A0A5N6DP12_ASPPA|nr:hypothetical protein BDV34DRAFT_192978 [Aspergillus parasiticus]
MGEFLAALGSVTQEEDRLATEYSHTGTRKERRMQVDEGQMVLGGFSVRRRGGAAIAALPSAAVEWAMTSQKGRSKGSLEERERTFPISLSMHGDILVISWRLLAEVLAAHKVPGGVGIQHANVLNCRKVWGRTSIIRSSDVPLHDMQSVRSSLVLPFPSG